MEKIISIYWFVILFLVAGGIYAMVIAFYGHPYDVRELEVNALSEKVADCISYKGVLNSNLYDGEFNSEFKKNFLEECDLNFDVEERWQETQYYVFVEVFDINEKSIFNFDYGNLNLFSSCELQKNKDYEKLAYCSENKFYSTYEGKQFLIKILSVVGKVEKNVK